MAIAKKPKSNPIATEPQADVKAVAFIAGAGRSGDTPPRMNKVPIMIRFDSATLAKVDESARRRGISRSSWIQFTISKALEHGEG